MIKQKFQLFLSEKTLLYNKKSLPLNQAKVIYELSKIRKGPDD